MEVEPTTQKAWWQVGRILASLPFFALGGVFLASYGLSWIVFPWDREFLTLGVMFLLCPAGVLFLVGALIVGWRHIGRTVAWSLAVLGTATIVHVAILRAIFSLQSSVEMLPGPERVRTLELVQRITIGGMIVGALFLLSGLALLARERKLRTV